jgi:hypothetical protein
VGQQEKLTCISMSKSKFLNSTLTLYRIRRYLKFNVYLLQDRQLPSKEGIADKVRDTDVYSFESVFCKTDGGDEFRTIKVGGSSSLVKVTLNILLKEKID